MSDSERSPTTSAVRTTMPTSTSAITPTTPIPTSPASSDSGLCRGATSPRGRPPERTLTRARSVGSCARLLSHSTQFSDEIFNDADGYIDGRGDRFGKAHRLFDHGGLAADNEHAPYLTTQSGQRAEHNRGIH